MRIKLLKECNGAKPGSICECDEVQGQKLLEDGIAEMDCSTEKSIEEAVDIVAKQIVINKSKKENKMSEFIVGKMFQDAAKKAITGNNEATPADGGALVHTGIAELAPMLMAGSVAYAKARKIPVAKSANSMKVPFMAGDWYTNADVAVSGSIAEGIAGTPTKIVVGSRTLTLNKAVVPVAITEELLEDVEAVDAYVRSEMVGKLATRLDYGVFKGAYGLAALIGDTGYTATSTISGSTTLIELQTLVNKVHPMLNPEFYVSITAWAKLVGTFGTAANIMQQLIDISGKKLLGYKVNVCPVLAATDIVFGDMSQYTVIESPLSQRLQVSNEVRFLEGEIVYKLTSRQAGALTLPTRATGDSLVVGGFVTNA